MSTKKQIALFAAIAVLFSTATALPAKPADTPDSAISLVIYSEGFALVSHQRQMEFKQGINLLKFTEIAPAIEPDTATFKCISAPEAITILEQFYRYDLANTTELLRKYVGSAVTVLVKGSGAEAGSTITGTLLAPADNQIILKADEQLRIISRENIEQVLLGPIRDDLACTPTLFWLAEANKSGPQLCRISYTTAGLGWTAQYSATLNPEEDKIGLTGWATISNNSGSDYKDAAIKLVAGKVRRVQHTQPIYAEKLARMQVMDDAAGAAFEEIPFAEYHLYSLSRTSTINDNQLKQIELIPPASAVPVKKLYIYNRQEKPDKVQTKFEFENTAANKLGMPLPAGRIRLFKKDARDDVLVFVGEDRIGHTAKDEKITLYIGDSFDIAVQYTPLDSRQGRRDLWEKHKVELRNRKDESVLVHIDEKFPPHVNWMIESSTHKYEKHDAHTARFEVPVPANQTVAVEYTATQSW
jgi:hypothetical protein